MINNTSVKGRLSLPRISVYGITKYGGENFSDCLRLEMRKFGVKVVIVEPGNFGGVTGILSGSNVYLIKLFQRDINSLKMYKTCIHMYT